MDKIIVKVGKKSELAFSGCKAIRVLFADELNEKFSNNECHIVVIEKVYEHEEEEVRQFVSNLISDENNKLFFYIPDEEDMITSGIADEFEYDIYMNKSDLYKAVGNTLGYSVSTIIMDRKPNQVVSDNITEEEVIANTSLDKLGEELINSVEENSSNPDFDIKTQIKRVLKIKEAEFNEKVSDLESDINFLRNEKNNIEAELNNHKTQAEKDKSEIESLGNELNTIKEEKEQQDIELTRLREDIGIFVEKDKVNEAKILELKESHEKELSNIESTKNTEIENLKKQNEETIQNINNSHTVEISTLENEKKLEIENRDSRIAGLEQNLSEVKSDRDRLAELDKNNTDTITQLNSEKESLQNSNDSLNGQLDILNKAYNSTATLLETEKSNNEQLRTEISSMQSDLDKLNKEIKAANDKIQKQQEAGRNINIDRKELREANAQLADEKSKLEENNKKLEKDYSSLIEEHRKLQDEFDINKLENERLTDENSKSLDELNKLRNNVKSFESQSNRCKQLLEAEKAKNETLEAINEELQEYKDNIGSNLESEKHNLQSKVSDLEFERDELSDKVDNLQKQLNKSNEELGTLKSNNAELSTIMDECNSLRDELEKAQAEAAEANLNVGMHESKIKELSKNLDDLEEENEALKIDNSDKVGEISELMDRVSELEETIASNTGDLEYSQTELEDLQNSTVDNLREISELRDKNEELENKIEYLEKQLSDVGVSTTVSNVDDTEVTRLKSNIRLLTKSNSTLKKELDTEKDKNKKLSTQYSKLKTSGESDKNMIKALKEENRKIKAANTKMSNKSAKRGVKAIDYNQRATILSILGTGSFGITITAVSLAYKLASSSKVLFLDFDTVSPKADIWFKTSPMCQSLADNRNDIKASGLGIFIEKGIKTFKGNYSQIYKEAIQTRGGYIHYISGLYYRADEDKLIGANYSELFQFLGNMYDYIIVDLGRLGSSYVGDSIINSICNISKKVIAVSMQNKFEVRDLNVKLQEAAIDINNVALLLNMCENTNISKDLRDKIGTNSIGQVMYAQELMGEKDKNFIQHRISKDKFEMFINSCVF